MPVVATTPLIAAGWVSGTAPTDRGQAAGLGYLAGRVIRVGDQAVVLGVPVQAAQRGHKMLGGAAAARALRRATTWVFTWAISCRIF